MVKLINEQLSGLKPQERTQMLNELLKPYDNEQGSPRNMLNPQGPHPLIFMKKHNSAFTSLPFNKQRSLHNILNPQTK